MAAEKQKIFVIKPDPGIVIEKIMPICRCKCTTVGIMLVIIGILWYLRNVGALPTEVFWPVILVIAGIVCWLKAAKISK